MLPLDTIRHLPEQQRFVAEVDGEAAYLAYDRVDEHTLDYHSTFVPTALRGRGLATALALHALDYAQTSGLRVIPSCPFVASTIQRNPEYASIVAS